MIDAVLSYHLNPFTCGVAKFNLQLAKRLGVPCLPIGTPCQSPLVSIKASEMGPTWMDCLPVTGRFTLLLHDRPTPTTGRADRIFYADQIGCPSTLEGNHIRGPINVLLFGMAHKIDVHTVYVERLRDLLQRASDSYTVSVSTAVHEGTPWDGAFTKTVDNLRRVFGDHLRVLGYLADDALAKELHDCTAAALFFDPAVRANNTTLWGALTAGCPVVTNLDKDSPADLIHGHTVLDLARLTHWPFQHVLYNVGLNGQLAAKAHSWEKLIEALR